MGQRVEFAQILKKPFGAIYLNALLGTFCLKAFWGIMLGKPFGTFCLKAYWGIMFESLLGQTFVAYWGLKVTDGCQRSPIARQVVRRTSYSSGLTLETGTMPILSKTYKAHKITLLLCKRIMK